MGRRQQVVAVLALLAASCPEDEPPPCDPIPEECNNLDDDCDGAVDEGEGGGMLRRDCGNACGPGQEECQDGEWRNCSAPQPMEELCNGLDDNCDGLVDEVGCDCTHGQTRPCGTDVGECELGVQYCENGSWGECHTDYDPADHPEICDGLDNDCDGETDESCSCDPGSTQRCGTDEGECVAGSQTCTAEGSWDPLCAGEVGPAVEVCDSLDNDCDGDVDGIASVGLEWSRDRFELNDTCGDASGIYASSGRAEVNEGVGWIGLPVEDASDLSSYPTLYPGGEEDWYSTRAVEGDRGFCWPWETMCSYLFQVQLTLLDRDVLGPEHQDPADYRVCVSFGDCTAAVDPASMYCTHLDNWNEEASAYLLSLIWGAGCGDASRDAKIYVNSPTGAACGHYQLFVRFDYDSSIDCP